MVSLPPFTATLIIHGHVRRMFMIYLEQKHFFFILIFQAKLNNAMCGSNDYFFLLIRNNFMFRFYITLEILQLLIDSTKFMAITKSSMKKRCFRVSLPNNSIHDHVHKSGHDINLDSFRICHMTIKISLKRS